MRTFNGSAVIALAATVALLTGCGAGATSGLPAVMRQDAATRGDALLYVTNYSSTVTIYSYPDGKKVALATGAKSAVGACTDREQNVYITDADDGRIYEYVHGQTVPFKTLADPDGTLDGCAVDPSNGDLAVSSNHFDTAGSLLVYHGGIGKPVQYGVKTFCHYDTLAYDDRGNLFGGGFGNGDCSQPNGFHLYELRPGSARLTLLQLDVAPQYASAVRWDGSHVLIGDELAKQIDRYEVYGDQAEFVGSIALQGIPYLHNFIVTAYANGYRVISNSRHTVRSWKYPQGGAPVTEIKRVHAPIDFALSE